MNLVKKMSLALLVLLVASMLAVPVCAAGESGQQVQTAAEELQAEDSKSDSVGMKAGAVGVARGLAAAGGAVGMGSVGGKAADGISRQPEMESKIRTAMMLALVFIETAIIYALLVVILVIFVL